MAKKCFLSFHYQPDSWRVSQIAEMGSIEEQPILSRNKWEEIKRKGDAAIETWIETNMKGKECLVVLIGAKTAGRPWVTHEIKLACEKGIGVLGIYVHNLKNSDGKQTSKGADPFKGAKVGGTLVSTYAEAYDPPYTDSKDVYKYIAENIETWIATAIERR